MIGEHPVKMVQRASCFAMAAHTGQYRKYTGQPYYSHCREVAELVEQVGGTPEMVAAAWLHDTIEDTDVTGLEIDSQFGVEVWEMVVWLTDQFTPKDYPNFNRAERKRRECERYSYCPPEVAVIKWADMVSNTSSIVKHDPQFSVVYLREKADLLEVIGPKVIQWREKHGRV